MLTNYFFATIPYGPIINEIYSRVEYNLNLHNQRPKETDTFRDIPFSMTDKVMMHTGPTLFNEAIYDALWECEDIDCGEYILLSGKVFGYKK